MSREPGRHPTPDESRLLLRLATLAGMERPERWVATIRVRDMHDGGMGSLELFATKPPQEVGSAGPFCRAAVRFTDADGVEVIASLYYDDDGAPFELDMWKVDSSRLVRIPHDLRPLEE